MKQLYTKCKKAYSLAMQNGVRKAIQYFLDKKKIKKREFQIIKEYHLLSDKEITNQREKVWEEDVCISILTPLYNTPKKYLVELLESVKKQTYPNWQLCLADGSDEAHAYVKKICEKYAKIDSRIVYKKLDENEGIVGNTNQCIGMAKGDYIGLLDHDDLLHPSALYEAMIAINDGADFIYTDEMKFSGTVEESVDIVCKNGFGKDELRAHNYICHFVVFCKNLLEGMEQIYRKECEGSQDYDMVLRLTEKAKKIVHIPQILYYWRVHQGSVSMDLSVKQYAVEAAKTAISDHLRRSQEIGKVVCNLPYQTIYKIEYEINDQPLISIIIWNHSEGVGVNYLDELLQHTDYRPLEIIMPERVGEIPVYEGVSYTYVERKSGGNVYDWMNCALKTVKSEYIILLNSQISPGNSNWIREMLMYAQREDVGVVGPFLGDKENHILFAGAVMDQDEPSGIHVINAGMDINIEGYEANMRHIRNTTVLSELCIMVALTDLNKLGGLDLSMGEYVIPDLCLRAREKGYWNVWNCFSKLNYYGQNEIKLYSVENKLFKNKWKNKLESMDDYYHPLLKKLKRM